eukprot:3936074-Rhodomonas_salina.3
MSFAATVSAGSEQTRFDSSGNIKRTVLVNIQGSPASLDSLGGDAGSWSLTPEQAMRIFARESHIPPDQCMKEIRNVILRRVRVLEYKSNAPDVCGLYIEGLPGNEFTQTGEDHHMFLLGAGQSSTPQDIFVASGDTDLGMQWMQQFPNYNKENIRTNQVMRLNGADYYFVHEDHPVINLLYHNQDALGTKIDCNDKVNNYWYRVNTQVFDDSCHTLDTEIFSKTPQVYDLSRLRVRIRRPDNKRWLDTPMLHELAAATDQATKEILYKRFTDTPIYVVARMELEYAVPKEAPVSTTEQ